MNKKEVIEHVVKMKPTGQNARSAFLFLKSSNVPAFFGSFFFVLHYFCVDLHPKFSVLRAEDIVQVLKMH